MMAKANKPTKTLAFHRPNAAVVVFNKKGKVLICRRAGERGKDCWQFPQGGIDSGEKALAAAYRELREETGIRRRHVKLMGKIKGWVAYDFPDNVYMAPVKRKRWRGQKQKWFAMRFSGKSRHIRLDGHGSPEFDKWKWVDLAEVPDMTIGWKRKTYKQVAKLFARFSK